MTLAPEAPTSSLIDQLTQGFRNREPGHLIGDRWVPSQSGKTFEVVNPATGDVLANVALGEKADIDAAVEALPGRRSTGRGR